MLFLHHESLRSVQEPLSALHAPGLGRGGRADTLSRGAVALGQLRTGAALHGDGAQGCLQRDTLHLHLAAAALRLQCAHLPLQLAAGAGDRVEDGALVPADVGGEQPSGAALRLAPPPVRHPGHRRHGAPLPAPAARLHHVEHRLGQQLHLPPHRAAAAHRRRERGAAHREPAPPVRVAQGAAQPPTCSSTRSTRSSR